MRALFEAERTPVGLSVGQRSVDFWRFADAELGTNVGTVLTAAPGRHVDRPAAVQYSSLRWRL